MISTSTHVLRSLGEVGIAKDAFLMASKVLDRELTVSQEVRTTQIWQGVKSGNSIQVLIYIYIYIYIYMILDKFDFILKLEIPQK